jgi:hypothetical protein
MAIIHVPGTRVSYFALEPLRLELKNSIRRYREAAAGAYRTVRGCDTHLYVDVFGRASACLLDDLGGMAGEW